MVRKRNFRWNPRRGEAPRFWCQGVADYPVEPGAQKFQLPPSPLELVGVGVAPDHDGGALGEAMTITEHGVDDALRQRLKARFSEDTLAELTGLIAFQNLSSKFNAALDVPPQGFCIVP